MMFFLRSRGGHQSAHVISQETVERNLVTSRAHTSSSQRQVWSEPEYYCVVNQSLASDAGDLGTSLSLMVFHAAGW